MLRDACKVALAGVAAFSAYQLTLVVADELGDAFQSGVEWLIVQDIGKQYEVLEKIGEWVSSFQLTISGKTSTIYKARRKSDGVIVALKVISKLNVYALESKAFDTERRILSVLMHPNIVSLLGSESTLFYSQLDLELSKDGSVRVRGIYDIGVRLCSCSWSPQRAARTPDDHTDARRNSLSLQRLWHSPSRHQAREHSHIPNALLLEIIYGTVLQCDCSGEFAQLQTVW